MGTYTLHFTKTALVNIQTPLKPEHSKGGVFDTYKDTKEKGLVLLASNGGAKTFYFYAKVNKKPERIKLGSFPKMTVEEARKEAGIIRGQVLSGKSPTEEKKRLQKEITFGEMFKQFMERYSKPFKRSWKYDEREVNKFLTHWFSRKASQISKAEIQRLHEKIHNENGLYQANRILERIRAIYNKALEWGWEGINPTNGIKKFREHSRDRFLQADELPRFFQALSEEENEIARDYILMSLLTGARKQNVLSMQWKEIDFTAKTWRIPKTKNGDSLTIPLVGQTIAILKRCRERNSEIALENKEYVFPGSGKKGHLTDPKKAWKRILRKARINDLRIHDLRRTLGSWQAATGATTAIIAKSLGHKSQQATAVYERLNVDPVRSAMERAAEAMLN